MTATSTPSRPDPSRSGAVWVTGMGAFLLLAAAAVFTAVRWEQIPDAAKLGALVAATGTCLVSGRALRQTLPATAGALLHLGAFLVPIDVAAIGVRADLDWSTLLLAEGLVAAATFGWAARSERSVVLRWAFGVSIVALAGGVGATTPLPGPLVLAGFAAASTLARRDDAAIGWAALAGAAPLLTFLDRLELTGSGTFERLGLVGDQPRAIAVLTGGIAALVLAVTARRRDDVGLALLGVLAGATGVAASWTGLERDGSDTLVGLAVAFLVVEVAAFATRADAFWQRPAGVVARLAELVAGTATLAMVGAIALVPLDPGSDGRAALAAAVLGLGWVTVELRTGRGRVASTVGMAVAVVGAVALATGSPVAVASVLVGVAAAGVLLPQLAAVAAAGTPGWTVARPGAHVLAAVAAISAPLIAVGTSSVTVALAGIAGSVVVTEAAVRRSRSAAPDDVTRANEAESWAWVLAMLAMVPGGIAVAYFTGSRGETAAALVAGAVLATLVAAQADRGRTPSTDLPLGTVARMHAAAVLAGTAGLPPVEIGLVALAVAILSAVDAVRLQRTEVALGASIATPIAVGGLSHAAGLSLASTGVALTVAAAVLAGLGSQLGRRWAGPVIVVTGGIGLAAAIATGRLDGVYLAGIAITGGIWVRLTDAGVGASEPYLLPVGVLLLIAGLRARSIGTSSWIAYGPVVGLLGGAALLERMGGGAGWHAVVAGAVAILAVAAGGARRLAAPLLLGSGLLVALVAFETLAITSTFPTWVWLGLGGVSLLGAGVAMERRDTGPIETGRRRVDVVTDRYV